MIEKNEMDGGITNVQGKRMQIVLDERGVYLRTEEPGAPSKVQPSSMDLASARGAAATEPPVASLPDPTNRDTRDSLGPQASGFRSPM